MTFLHFLLRMSYIEKRTNLVLPPLRALLFFVGKIAHWGQGENVEQKNIERMTTQDRHILNRQLIRPAK